MIVKKPTKAPVVLEYSFIKNTDLTSFFKTNITKDISLSHLQNLIQYNVGIEVSRKIVKCTESIKMGGVCSNQIPNEIASFLFYLYQNKIKIDTYLEVGVNRGGTFYLIDSFLRAINPDYKYGVAVDIKNNLLESENYLKKYPNTKLIWGDSKKLRLSEKFGMVLIDGDHSYEGVKTDFLNFRNNSNILCFHDIDILHRRTNVKKLWQEIKKDYPNKTVEFLNKSPDFECNLGIGLLIK